ncbi:hypothetical protein DDG15_11685, partial [Neisseria gonorrhoeae]
YQAFEHIGSTDPHFRQSTLPTVAAFLFDIQSHFQKTYDGNKIILPPLGKHSGKLKPRPKQPSDK